VVFRPDTPLYREASALACIRPDDSAARPNDSQCLTKLQIFFPKSNMGRLLQPSRRCGFPSGCATYLRQVRNSNSTVRTPVYYGPDARTTDMEITCRRSTFRTVIPKVRTREALVRKLLAADVRPSGRQCFTIQTRLSNRKDFQRKSPNFGFTVVRPDGS
jgi:hypothetical protein